MISYKSEKEFAERYDLYDRGINFVERKNENIHLSFSLFHCDDVNRCDEEKDYTLDIFLPAYIIKQQEGDFHKSENDSLGEVLELDKSDQGLKIGINWRNRKTGEVSWSSFVISGGPINAQETVRPVAETINEYGNWIRPDPIVI